MRVTGRAAFFATVASAMLLLSACSVAGMPTHADYVVDRSQAYETGFYGGERINDFYLDDSSNYYSYLKPGNQNLLLFWADWCPHCTSLIKRMGSSSASDEIADNLVAISEETSDTAEMETLSPRSASSDQNWGVFDQHGLEHIPALFVVDGSGRVLGSAEGEEACTSLLLQYESNLKTSEKG